MQIICDPKQMDVAAIHAFLSEQSAWARGIPLALVEKSLQHSLCFGGFIDGRQIAFARVVSDHATFAYLMDVYVLPAFRGRGYSRRLMEAVLAHPELISIRRFVLVSSSARGLYQQFGFAAPARPETFMEIHRPQIYQSADGQP